MDKLPASLIRYDINKIDDDVHTTHTVFKKQMEKLPTSLKSPALKDRDWPNTSKAHCLK